MSDQGAGVQADVTGAAGAGAVTVVNDDDAMGAAFDRIMTNNGSDRGDGGRFVSPNGQGSDTSSAATGDDGAGADAGAAAATANLAAPAPAHLPQGIKAIWGKLDATDQAEFGKFVKEQDSKFGDVGAQLREMKPFHDEFSNAMRTYPEWKNVPPAELARAAIQLAAVQAEMDRGPESAVKTILEIAQTYKVLPALAQVFAADGEGVANGAGQGNSGQIIAGLEAKIAKLEAKLGNPDTIRTEVSKMKAEMDATDAFAAFIKDKEHIDSVLPDLPRFVDMVLEKSKGQRRPYADVLADAYDMAINANPEIRAKVRASEARATAANPDPKRTEAARKAASINVRPNANGKEKAMTEDEAFAAAYERATAH